MSFGRDTKAWKQCNATTDVHFEYASTGHNRLSLSGQPRVLHNPIPSPTTGSKLQSTSDHLTVHLTLRPRAAYLHRRPKLALRQEMTWRYIGTKPFIQPMLTSDAHNLYNKFQWNCLP